ncbi:methyltransferase [Roseobacter sp. HKCCA0434]|uniref:methyltransferase n=1 Tax=Roseobacter sp. HKCCA0434 TaxID=3079297 RepID=UPI002905A8F9|nr:methyltransferase [Roseobacter sp. HKCCA0434]
MAETRFLETLPGSLALDHAMRSGLIDRLHLDGEIAVPDEPVLVRLLLRAGVLAQVGGKLRLSEAFAPIWPARREALTHRLRFLKAAAVDLTMGLPALLDDRDDFMARSHTFGLFDYSQAEGTEPENLRATRFWCDYVATLTEEEAPAIVPRLDLDPGARVLEIGGNVGVMAAEVMQGTGASVHVLDLPAVCALGEERNAARPSGARPEFIAGDARAGGWDELPGAPFDAVLFKSVLHDWPEAAALELLDHATVAPMVVIAERAPLPAQGDLPFWMSADLVFAPFYRAADFYATELMSRGYEVEATALALDWPFNLIVGRRA